MLISERYKGKEALINEEKKLIEKFQLLVDKKDNESCWEWLGDKDACDQGIFKVGRNKIEACVISWLTFFGDIPKGKAVWHRCNNIGCVNPYHLYLEDVTIVGPSRFLTPKDFKTLMPGTYDWMEFWRAHPEQQNKMIEYRKEVEGA